MYSPTTHLVVHDQLTPGRLLSIDVVETCARHLRNHGLVVLPTETGYMLAADAAHPDAIAAVFAAKGRPNANPIHVAVDSLREIERCVVLPHAGRRVCVQLMPGPITVIGRNREVVPELLVAHTETLGVRVPDCPAALQVINAFGGPVTATSLNASGSPPHPDPQIAVEQLTLGGTAPIHMVVDPNAIVYDKPSTVVRFASDAWEILRDGPISEYEISRAASAFTGDDVADWT